MRELKHFILKKLTSVLPKLYRHGYQILVIELMTDMYNEGQEQWAVDLGLKLYDIDHCPQAYDLFQKQRVYPMCGYCTFPLRSDEVHPYCDRQLDEAHQAQLEEMRALCDTCHRPLEVFPGDGETCQDCLDQADHDAETADDFDYSDDEIDDASREEIEHGMRMGML